MQIRLQPVYFNFIFALHYGQRITQVSFNSISMDREYQNAVFMFMDSEHRLNFCCFSSDLSILPCHSLFCGGDPNTPSSCI